MATAVATIASAPGTARGAAFDLLQDQSSADATTADNTPPCTTTVGAANAQATAGAQATVRTSLIIGATGESEVCHETARAVGEGKGVFKLIATMGESEGDPVTVCAMLTQQTFLSVLDPGDDLASAEYHMSTANVVGSGPLIAQPPRRLIVDRPPPFQTIVQCHREFTLKIGENIRTSVGATATAEVNGLGGSVSRPSSELRVRIGPCGDVGVECSLVTPSPTFSHTGLWIMTLALASLGVLVARRRGQRA